MKAVPTSGEDGVQGREDHTTDSLGFPYGFPFKPYQIQIDLMDKVYYTLSQEGRFAVLESPTGTGKTLSILCSVITWLRENETALLQQQLAAPHAQKENSISTLPPPNVPAFVVRSVQRLRESQLQCWRDALQEQLADVNSRAEKIKQDRAAFDKKSLLCHKADSLERLMQQQQRQQRLADGVGKRTRQGGTAGAPGSDTNIRDPQDELHRYPASKSAGGVGSAAGGVGCDDDTEGNTKAGDGAYTPGGEGSTIQPPQVQECSVHTLTCTTHTLTHTHIQTHILAEIVHTPARTHAGSHID
eukprot:GHVQ01026192.1.p1 GENE.GHVQ01026192.1~~GHVQ01026192.1.p1  ORF type:complete len:301 (-),score=64.98 GHVQ01026192.1:1433-2335(-)